MPVYLLDKNVARRTIEALYHLDNLADEEQQVLELWRRLRLEQVRLFIPAGVIHILQPVAHLLEVRAFLATVEPLDSGRYLKRWARRLREYSFTREDALILALATFGIDSQESILGVDGLITLDQLLIRNFQNHQAELQARLAAMVSDLPVPYCNASLPEIQHPGIFEG